MGDRPNLLFVMADQFRAMSIGSLGSDPVHTPALDRLAEEGAHVDTAVSNYPVCSPHRAMFMTGQHPSRNGVWRNVNSRTAPLGVGLREGLPTWAGVLREEGYRTGYIGKWHLQAPVPADAVYGQGVRSEDGVYWDAYSPVDRRYGFDFWYSYGAADDHMSPHYWVGVAPREGRVDVDEWSAEHEVGVAVDFISRTADGDAPFALMLSLNPPHQPFDAIPERYRHRYDALTAAELLPRPNVPRGDEIELRAAAIAKEYFCAISAVDDQVGRLLSALDEAGLRENTAVAFSSDHGMQLGSHGLIYKNVPFEESMRLPFLLRWPGRIAPGPRDVMVDSGDVGPTLLGLLGFGTRVPEEMQGEDCSAALRGETAQRHGKAAVYYHFPGHDNNLDVRGLRTRDAKLVAALRPDGGLDIDYYHLRSDPYELRSDPGNPAARGLATRLLDELESLGEPWAGAGPLRRWAEGQVVR